MKNDDADVSLTLISLSLGPSIFLPGIHKHALFTKASRAWLFPMDFPNMHSETAAKASTYLV